MNSTKEIQERTEPHKEEAPIDDRLVSAEELLDIIWTPTSRPSLRWLREQQALRTIPFTKVAGRVWFSPHQVRECLAQDWTLRRRAFRPGQDVPAVIIGSGPTPGPKHTAARIAQTNVGWPPLPVAATRQHWHNLSFSATQAAAARSSAKSSGHPVSGFHAARFLKK